MIKYILKKIRLFSNARKEPYLSLYKILGFYPHKIGYYQLALRHSSVSVTTSTGHLLSNERLEFLGDAVLNSVITDILYRKFENEREGFLTNTRSKIVKRESLNRLAIYIGLDKQMITTRHVNANTNNNIYGNALEALMGAIYLDYGYKQCKKFIETRLLNNFIDLGKIVEDEENYKSRIIEWCQKYKLEFEFLLLNDEMVGENKHSFTTALKIQGQTICEDSGSSKKESQQNTSRKAWKIIQSSQSLAHQLIAKSVVKSAANTTNTISGTNPTIDIK